MNLLHAKKIIVITSFLVFSAFCQRVEAAVLLIKPSQAEVSVDNIINVQVYVNTAGKVINNAESIIEYPKDLLEVISLDSRSSIFSLWVEQPTFTNSTGQVTLNGGVPNPGFSGTNGNVISIIFKAKKAGTASILFSNSAVRENDGLGTDILSGKVGAEITIVSGQKVQPAVDSNFVITSSSHPNQNLWFNKNNVDLSWTLPKNAVAVKTLLGAYKDSEPTIYYDSPLASKNLKDIEDGTWYFHANYLAGGVWSKAQHYKLQIDTAGPTNLSVNSEKDTTGKVTLHIKAGDSLSGVDHYQVAADSDKPMTVKSDSNGDASIEIPFYTSGEHTLVITAFDKAGNSAETKTTITTSYVLELRIDSYPAEAKINESIGISGTAPYPYAPLRISLKDSENVVQTYKIKSNSYSKFDFISQPVLVEGDYTLWVDMLKDNEEISLSSQKVTVSVQTPLLLQIGYYTISLMKVLIPAAVLLILFLLILLYGWYKFFNLYRKVKRESSEAEKILGKSFKILHKDLMDHISKLRRTESKRKLTSEEIEFLERFEEELTEAESVLEKEVKDISKF